MLSKVSQTEIDMEKAMTSGQSSEKDMGETTRETMESVLKLQKEAFSAEGIVTAEPRIDRLNRAIDLLINNQDEFCQAMSSDFGHRSFHLGLLGDIMASVAPMKSAKKHLRKWMKPEKRKTVFPFGLFGAKAWIEYQPKGVVGIISPWNFPVGLTFTPLGDVLAAGNRCMIKPSEFTPATAELMKGLVRKSFDETEIAVITGGPETGQAFSGLAFDHLLFTGSTAVGKHVMKAAAENLVPVTLELGGKSPVIFDRKPALPLFTNRLMLIKMMNAGQICVAPDYVFVPEEMSEEIIASIQKSVRTMFPALLKNPDYTSVLNARHYERLQGYLEDARAKGAALMEINPANEDFAQQPHCKMPPTLVLKPTDEMTVMQEEIFGPILPIKTYKNLQEAIDYINARPRPLALYYFGNDARERSRVVCN